MVLCSGFASRLSVSCLAGGFQSDPDFGIYRADANTEIGVWPHALPNPAGRVHFSSPFAKLPVIAPYHVWLFPGLSSPFQVMCRMCIWLGSSEAGLCIQDRW